MPTGYKNILSEYEKLPQDVKDNLGSFKKIIEMDDKDTFDMLVAYLFIKADRGQRRLLYGVAVRDYRVDSDIAKEGYIIDGKQIVKSVYGFQMTRSNFYKKYAMMADGKEVDKDICELMDYAEKRRNEVLHGKIVRDSKKVKTIKLMLKYIKLLNEQADDDFGLTPFGSLQGFAAGIITLDTQKSISLLRQIESDKIPPQ